MVDITKVQLNPIPPPIAELQNTNAKLLNNQKTINTVFYSLGLLITVIIVLSILNQNVETNERREEN
jgi:hypothetical protein